MNKIDQALRDCNERVEATVESIALVKGKPYATLVMRSARILSILQMMNSISKKGPEFALMDFAMKALSDDMSWLCLQAAKQMGADAPSKEFLESYMRDTDALLDQMARTEQELNTILKKG